MLCCAPAVLYLASRNLTLGAVWEAAWYAWRGLRSVRGGLAGVQAPCLPYRLPCLPSGGFTIQPYKGAQKPSPMELIRAQATRKAEDLVTFKPPKMDIPALEGKKEPPRPHNLKPRDMNVLTPTGF